MNNEKGREQFQTFSFLSGCEVGIATLELSDSKYMKRIGSNALNIQLKDYDSLLSKDQVGGVREKIELLKLNNLKMVIKM